MGGEGWERETRTAMAGRTQESGVGELPGNTMAGGGDTGKAISTASKEKGVRGCHGARPDNRGMSRGRR